MKRHVYEQAVFFGHVRSLFQRRPLNVQSSMDIKLFKMLGYDDEDLEVLRRFAGLVADHCLEALIKEKEDDRRTDSK